MICIVVHLLVVIKTVKMLDTCIKIKLPDDDIEMSKHVAVYII